MIRIFISFARTRRRASTTSQAAIPAMRVLGLLKQRTVAVGMPQASLADLLTGGDPWAPCRASWQRKRAVAPSDRRGRLAVGTAMSSQRARA
jgi:hypothetical protein